MGETRDTGTPVPGPEGSGELKPDNPAVKSELQEYIDIGRQRHRLLPRALLAGLCAGAVAMLFRWSLEGAVSAREHLIHWAYQFPRFGWIFPMVFGAAGAKLAVVLVRRYAPEAAGSGIPHLKAVLHRLRDLNWTRLLPTKFVGGVLAIGSGMALGREGPTVQMGGAVGDAIARWLKVAPRERLTLVASGAGAGLAAAFNAPLSGLVFVLEEVQRDFRPIVFSTAFIAAAGADVLARLASGQHPVFSIPGYPAPPLTALPAFALLGVLAGLFGVFFNKCLIGTLDFVARLPRGVSRWFPVAVGAVVGLVAWNNPMAVGGGHKMAEHVLREQISIRAIELWFLVRFTLLMVSYGTGAPGGIFAPLLGLGALLGLAVGEVGHYLFPSAIPQPGAFAVVGMAAYFTAIVRAPLTGVVLIIEMTGNYAQMLPLLISCFCASATADLLRDMPIYEALLDRDLRHSGTATILQEPIIVDFEIEPGSPFEGREIRTLGLPAGCIIIRCFDSGREWIPRASTQLEPHMRITSVIAPEAAQGLELLRKGCETQND